MALNLKKYSDRFPVRRFIKFGIVGVSGIFVNQTLLYCLTEFVKIDYRFSSIFAIECAIANNFLFNALWTWQDRKVHSGRQRLWRFVKFNLSSGATAIVFNWSILVLLTERFHVQYLIANLFGIALATGANFLINHFWTFSNKKKADTRTIQKE